MKKPNFFIIGAPKCGTTSLAHYLSQHPNVFITKPKEPGHYCTDFGYYEYKDRKKYFELYEKAGEKHLAVGEGSATYLYSKQAIPNILKEFPDAKFIVMLRNPIEMAPSLHEEMYFGGADNEPNFETAWSLQSSRVSGINIPAGCIEPQYLQYQAACSLGYQVDRLFGWVKREQVLLVLLEDLTNDPRTTWLTVLDFLGLADDGRTSFPVLNQAKEMRLRIVPKLANFYQKFMGRLGVRPLGLGIMTLLLQLNIKTRQRQPLTNKIKNELMLAFRDDIELLSKHVKRDLSHWVNNTRDIA
jgi:hypothetical protein